ncbi:MAG: ZIP family metal transporter [Candidatus Omnitrophota bacterium]
MTLLYILASVIITSAISLIGVLTIGVKNNLFERFLVLIVGFAAGGMIGGAFLHLLPEALELGGGDRVFLYALVGFTVFFIMERYFHWRHCHDDNCEVHPFTYLNLAGDGLHNFTDGIIIAASFVTDVRLGVVTTLAVIFHEIPQEIGDFGILVYGGFSKRKALLLNFLCALFSVIGAILGYALSTMMENTAFFFISFTAGGFIYIAACDLIPELHRQKNAKRSNAALAAFIAGLVFMALAKTLL